MKKIRLTSKSVGFKYKHNALVIHRSVEYRIVFAPIVTRSSLSRCDRLDFCCINDLLLRISQIQTWTNEFNFKVVFNGLLVVWICTTPCSELFLSNLVVQ